MPILLRHEDVLRSITMADAIEAMAVGLRDEAAGAVMAPHRHNLRFGAEGRDGFFRIGPCALLNAGWMGFKSMNLAKGEGVRYQIHLYEMRSGELAAIMDGQHITTLRTGAMSAVATQKLAPPGPVAVAVLGSGKEAWAQLEAMAAIGKVAEARIFSPTAANRDRVAARCREELKVGAKAVASAEQAIEGAQLVVSAVNSEQNVLFGRQLSPGMHINSVGTARPILREIDPEVFAVADIIAVDTREGVFQEAGDAITAVKQGKVSPERALELHQVFSGSGASRTRPDQITLFKSVGTSIQDIAAALRVYTNAKRLGIGADLGDFPYLLAKSPDKKYI